MINYAIRCETPGESVLAQKILFKKGSKWGWGGDHGELRREDQGQIICIRGRALTWLETHYSDDNLRERGFQVINMSELNNL